MLLRERFKKTDLFVNGFAGLLGGLGGLVVFFLFNFISGWDEYFATISSGDAVEYHGRHQLAAKVIETLGEMDVSVIGVIFGIIGLILMGLAVVSFSSLRKTSNATSKVRSK